MKRWAGRAVSAAAVAILFLTTGCSGFFVYPGSVSSSTTGSSTGTEFVYVINQTVGQNAGTLAGYSIGSSTLTAVTGSPQNITTFAPAAVAVNRANTMVFVAGGNLINTYAIGSGGALSLLASNTLTADEVAIDISPDGQWLLGLEATTLTFPNEARIDEFQINASGQLSLVSANPVAFYLPVGGEGTISPSAIKFAPANASGQLVFVALGTAGDLVYTFTTSSGALSAQPSQTFTLSAASQSADLALAVSPNGSAVYFARSSGTAGSVAAYTITGTTVAAVGGNSASAGDRPSAVVVDTASANVYVANQLSNNIFGFSGASSGNLALLSSSPYNVSDPTALAVDHSGDYLLAVSGTTSGNNLNMYSYDSSGNLVSSTSLNTGSLAVGLATTY
jgi:6-phosphogluconolactonase (cycloisomerase 2 family)